jgi:hypothetical protein
LNSKDTNTGWVLDSAASEHITNDRSDFSEFHESNESLQWGTDSECPVEGHGKVIMESNVGGQLQKMEASNVLYVPQFKYKILSTSAATKKGWRFLNTKNCVTATSENCVKFIAERNDKGFFNIDLNIRKTSKIENWIRRMNQLHDIFKNRRTDLGERKRDEQEKTTGEMRIY